MADGAFHGTIIHIREPSVREISSGGCVIRASCVCGHARDLEPARICIHPDTEISDVGTVLKCSKCGTRGLSTRVARKV